MRASLFQMKFDPFFVIDSMYSNVVPTGLSLEFVIFFGATDTSPLAGFADVSTLAGFSDVSFQMGFL